MPETSSNTSKPILLKPYKPPTVARRKRQPGNKAPTTRWGSLVHKCELCDYETADRTNLTIHMAKKHDPSIPLFKCNCCWRLFVTEAGLTFHVEAFHSEEFACPHCAFKTLVKSFFKTHLAKHEPAITQEAELAAEEEIEDGAEDSQLEGLRCQQCDFKTRSKTRLLIHQRRHEPKKAEQFKCKACQRKFKTDEARAEHMAEHQSLQCNLCDYETLKNSNLSKHRNSVHGVDAEGNPLDLLKCSECSYTTTFLTNMRRHHQNAHPSEESADGRTRLRCQLCRRLFKSTDELEQHMLNHETLKCSWCDYETKKLNQMTHHRVVVHSVYASGKPMPTYSCSECKFTSNKRSVLKYHELAMHSGLKPYPCNYCSFTTAYKQEVNRHINIAHLDMRPHACDLCDFRAIYPAQLKEHKHTHTGEKPHKCEFCEASFAAKKSLRLHMRDHSIEPRPHVCHKCGRAFKRSTHLAAHNKNIHFADKE